jgi:hypothetical protein
VLGKNGCLVNLIFKVESQRSVITANLAVKTLIWKCAPLDVLYIIIIVSKAGLIKHQYLLPCQFFLSKLPKE